MKTNSFFHYVLKGNPVFSFLMLAILCVMAFFIVGDINNMTRQRQTTTITKTYAVW